MDGFDLPSIVSFILDEDLPTWQSQTPAWNEKGCSSTVKMNSFFWQVLLRESASWIQILMVALVFPIPAPKSPQSKEHRPCFCQRWQGSGDIAFYGSWQASWNSSAWRHMQRGYRWKSSCGEAAWDPGWAMQHMAALHTAHGQERQPTSSQALSCLSTAVELPWGYCHAVSLCLSGEEGSSCYACAAVG